MWRTDRKALLAAAGLAVVLSLIPAITSGEGDLLVVFGGTTLAALACVALFALTVYLYRTLEDLGQRIMRGALGGTLVISAWTAAGGVDGGAVAVAMVVVFAGWVIVIDLVVGVFTAVERWRERTA